MKANSDFQARSTLRLQLHAGYTMDDARGDLPYFSRLGITHLYLSPITRSRSGSTHGYDVIDHTCVDEDRGGQDGLMRLSGEARKLGIGLLLDIVPNHMATDPDNGWWWDVLKYGRHSSKADWFDIDWNAAQHGGKVLAPFLAQPYEDALRAGDIRLQHDSQRGLHILVHSTPYPLSPESLSQLGLEDGEQLDPGKIQACVAAHDPSTDEGRRRLHSLLSLQHYRLAWWRDAAHSINWRRFFEVSELIGVRVEDAPVFDAVHELPLKLYAQGIIDGLRIDHVDGLAQPLSYCRKLRAAMEELRTQRPEPLRQDSPWIVVEKILAPGETLDERWAVSGTTGYDFAAEVGALLHAESGEAPLTKTWQEISGDDRPPEDWVVEARQMMLDRHFVAERRNLLTALGSVMPDIAETSLGAALDALLRHYPTYRSYVEDERRAPPDEQWFMQAMQKAKAELEDRGDGTSVGALHQLEQILGGKPPDSPKTQLVLRRFQQLTPPLAAKSLEDTVFYRYGSLISRNEVGSDPAVFSITVPEFHRACQRRAAHMSSSLLATATHDHKRGEDARARLAVLSELPELWQERSRRWLQATRSTLPDGAQAPVFHYKLLQSLVAAWPPGLSASDVAGVDELLDRTGDWLVKALREGKQLSSWFEPQTEHEDAWLAHLRGLAPGQPHHDVLKDIERLVRRLEPGAILNSFVQTTLRMTCPGIPDLYQGTEWRDFSLVDPDNRRAVDFEARMRSLEQLTAESGATLQPQSLPASAWEDGRAKQALIAILLGLRKDCPAAFQGSYEPLRVIGSRENQIVAFSRGGELMVVAAVKCAGQAIADEHGRPVLPEGYWGSTSVALPSEGGAWHDVLRARTVKFDGNAPLQQLLEGLPLAVLRRV